MKILVLDVGGTNVKVGRSGSRRRLKIPSGPGLRPEAMVAAVRAATAEWEYDAVSIGYPGPVQKGKPIAEPKNLGRGWLRFNFARAFRVPVRILNDAAMQALGSYRGGRMLFLGLGTGLGSALVVDGVVLPLELAHLPYRHGSSYEDYLGVRGLKRMGQRRWQGHVHQVIRLLQRGLLADYVTLGGGNTKKLTVVPRGVRVTNNTAAMVGGVRLWTSIQRW
ncbi:MAG TPA: ROK family protein [Gemmatimonadales bacterium]|jgi:polyphosphate glucokinase|nr:ROK family protein [Gemmatimonadales bacterium]